MDKFSSFCLVCCIFAVFTIVVDNSFANNQRSFTQSSQSTRRLTTPSNTPPNTAVSITTSDCPCVNDYKYLSQKRNLTSSEKKELTELKKCDCVINYIRDIEEERNDIEDLDADIMTNDLDQQISRKRALLQKRAREREQEALNRDIRSQDKYRQNSIDQDSWMHEEAQDNDDMLSFNIENNAILDLKKETLDHISKNLFHSKKHMIAEANAHLPFQSPEITLSAEIKDNNSSSSSSIITNLNDEINSEDFSKFRNQEETELNTFNKNTTNSHHEHKRYKINKKESQKLLKELDKYRKIYNT